MTVLIRYWRDVRMRLIDADALKLGIISQSNTGREDYSTELVCEFIDQQPTVGGWIPCSERMPDIDKIVLVSQTYSWKHFEDGASVTIGRLHQREKNTIPYWEFQYYRPDFKHGTIMDNGIICPGSEYVVAWQPLPDPYQPEGGKS